jgi:hypothetical protein
LEDLRFIVENLFPPAGNPNLGGGFTTGEGIEPSVVKSGV